MCHVRLLQRILLVFGEHRPVRIGDQQRHSELVESHDRMMPRAQRRREGKSGSPQCACRVPGWLLSLESTAIADVRADEMSKVSRLPGEN